MKRIVFSTVLFFLFSFIVDAQNQYNEAETSSNMAIGVYYQIGPGNVNMLNWEYPYGTKLSVIGNDCCRNFEFLSTSYPFGMLKFRQWNPSLDQWTSWRLILMEDQNGNVGIGTPTPTEKLTVKGNIDATGLNRRLYLGGLSGSTFGMAYSPSYPDHGIFYTEGNPDFVSISPNGNSTNGVLNVFGNGNVGIGTANPDAKLTVKGKIHAEEVKVDLSVPGPDYVFDTGYDLLSLDALQNYIRVNGHLPNIPSAEEMEGNGIELSVMNMKLLEKIEELTLYILQQEERLKAQQYKNKDLEFRLEKLEKLIQAED